MFWFFATRDVHPTTELAVIVTASLVAAFVTAAGPNQFLLIPRFCCTRRYATYALTLFGTTVLLAANA